MKKFILIALTVCMLILVSCGSKVDSVGQKAADVVVYGTIYTAEDANDGMAEAFAVKDGKFIYVGTREGADAYVQDGVTNVIDQTDKGLVIPGCTEGHGHFFGIDAVMKQLPGYCLPYDQLVELIKQEVSEGGVDRFFSYGLDMQTLAQDEANANRCFAEELEQIAPNIPVVLIDNNAHNALCNVTALKQAGLWDKQDLRGAEFLYTEDGKLSGVVMDQALPHLIDNVIGTMLTPEEYQMACLYAVENLHERGFTNCFDAWLNFADDSSLYRAIKEADDAGLLKMNVGACYNIQSYESDEYQQVVDHVADLASTYHSTHFNPSYIKLFADGVVESYTGWLKGEYVGVAPGKEHGNIVWTPEELCDVTAYANSKGITVHTHAYGDGAVGAVVDAYIQSNQKLGKQFRNGIGHARNVAAEDFKRIAENGISVAENLIWHIDFNFPAEFASYFPEGIIDTGYPMKSFFDQGVPVSSSTDSPCGEAIEGNIMNVIEVATTGQDYQAKGARAPYAPAELLTVKEALKTLTINGAWQLGLEDERGSIKEGKYSDFTILDTNFLDYTGEDLKTIHNSKILQIYFEGEKVY